MGEQVAMQPTMSIKNSFMAPRQQVKTVSNIPVQVSLGFHYTCQFETMLNLKIPTFSFFIHFINKIYSHCTQILTACETCFRALKCSVQ